MPGLQGVGAGAGNSQRDSRGSVCVCGPEKHNEPVLGSARDNADSAVSGERTDAVSGTDAKAAQLRLTTSAHAYLSRWLALPG